MVWGAFGLCSLCGWQPGCRFQHPGLQVNTSTIAQVLYVKNVLIVWKIVVFDAFEK